MQNDSYQPENTTPQSQLQSQPQPPAPVYQQPETRRRDLPYKLPWLAGFLSGIFPGIGQVYVGYYRQGITIALIFIGLITALATGDMSGLEPLFGMSLGFTWLYNIIDAARRAQAVNRALDGYGDQTVPEDMPLPGSGGSVVGGTALIVLGVVLVARTRFDLDMSWLADWWPLALVGLGAWLILKARTEKADRENAA